MTVPHKLIYSEETTITDPTDIWDHSLGVKHYEVTNYLGNVNAVITDRKTAALQTPTITDQENISVSGGEITRTLAGSSWGNCGGASVETVEQGGFMEWTIGGTSLDNNRYVTVGLSYTNADAHFNTIDYAWYTYTYGVNVYVGGNLPAGHVYGQYPGLAVGDVLKMERRDGNILFYQNSVLLYTAPDSYPQTPMIIDFAIVSGGRKIHDLKIQNSTNYEAVVVMKSDYYPFGMQMPGRNEESGEYRYGYNGMEKDDEVKGAGNSYTTEFRQYDPRIGRWLSLDPLMSQFPWMSPFVAFDNNPVYFIDPYGLESGVKDAAKSDDEKTSNQEDIGVEYTRNPNNSLPNYHEKEENINVNNDNSDSDFEIYWHPLTSDKLDKWTTNNPSTSGYILEDAWNRWALSSRAFFNLGYTPQETSDQYYSEAWDRNVAFDGVSGSFGGDNDDPESGDLKFNFRIGIIFYEVKRVQKSMLTKDYKNLGPQDQCN